jgi:glycogen synthase
LRILTLSNLYPPDVSGGYELACSQAVDALRECGHTLLVLTANPRNPLPTADADHVRRGFQLVEDHDWIEHDEHDTFLAARDAGSRCISAHNVHTLIETIEDFEPEVIYIHNLIGIGGLGLIATLQHLGVPWVWHLGDAGPRDLCSDRREIIGSLVASFNRTVRGQFIAVSQQLVDEIQASGIALKDRVHLVPYWFVGDRPDLKTVRTADPTEPSMPGRSFRIMSSGLVNRQKGIDVLIEAAAVLRRSGHDGFLVDIYGRVADASLSTMIRAQDLQDHVHLRGPRTHAEILSLYSHYDLFAFPTREREPFGIVPLEALARGCVPLITRRCGVAEWLTHGVHCLKAARTPEAFASAIQAILRGEIALEPIARRGESVAWSAFHRDAVMPAIESILVRAARVPRPSRGRGAEAYRLARLAERLVGALYSARTIQIDGVAAF